VTEQRRPPNAGKGRPKGSTNKTTALLKEAILLAAEQVGENGSGKDGLVGYLREVARSDVKAFAGLLGKVIPLQVNTNVTGKLAVGKYDLSDDELAAIAAGGSSGAVAEEAGED
jgi:hypothetical protein